MNKPQCVFEQNLVSCNRTDFDVSADGTHVRFAVALLCFHRHDLFAYIVQSLLSNVLSGVSKPRSFLASFLLVPLFLVNFEKSVMLSSLTALEHITHIDILLTNSDHL